jgi:hypothetical protein
MVEYTGPSPELAARRSPSLLRTWENKSNRAISDLHGVAPWRVKNQGGRCQKRGMLVQLNRNYWIRKYADMASVSVSYSFFGHSFLPRWLKILCYTGGR